MVSLTSSRLVPLVDHKSVDGDQITLDRLVARGPIASLYKGQLGCRVVAIKIYTEQWLAGPERIKREYLAQQKIDHPCVAATIGEGCLDDGSYAIVCEWIEGASLEERLQDGAVDLPTILQILQDLARGLGAVHEAGIVHRDIKPSNIMLPPGLGSAIITDFGHALLLDETRLTGSGLVVGSAHYMAPEQVAGLELDHRADIYAVGAVLYRMLTGVPPFEGASAAEVMRQHRQEAVIPPSARTNQPILQEAEDLCLWLLAKEREDRVPNAHVLRLTVNGIERHLNRDS